MAVGTLLAGAASCSEVTNDDNITYGYTGKQEYANFSTTKGENTTTFTYDYLVGGKVYYHLVYEWEFRNNACISCTITYECPSSTIAELVFEHFDAELKAKSRLSGKTIIMDMTDTYANASPEQVDVFITGIQESLEEQNEILNKQS